MKTTKLKYILYIGVLLFAWACSTKKKAFLNRAYHNTTAKYNGYFNAKESIKEGIWTYNNETKVDYDEVISLFTVPTEENVSIVSPFMDKSIEKTSKVISKHSMDIRGKEYCKWIDDNYMELGKSHFYKREFEKAVEMFEYVYKAYPDNPRRAENLSWLIKSYIELEDDANALLSISLLNKVEIEKKKQQKLKELTIADFYIYQENYPSAIPFLEDGIALEKKKKKRVKLQYLLAQLYNETGNKDMAIVTFREVAKKSPDYDMVFNAQIYQAKAVENKAMGYEVKRDLQAMLKDDKNIEYYDQIYYALADISFVERNYPEAIDYLTLSTQTSVNNPKQKAKSFLRLGDYYFLQKDYEDAGQYYDSAVTYLPNSAKNYKEVKKKQEDLEILVKELVTISRNDSLLKLSELDKSALSERLRMIRDKIERQEREKQNQALAMANSKKLAAATTAPKSKGSSSGTWYFYNDKALKSGIQEFAKNWGDRKNEDNWRLSSKQADFTSSSSTTASNPVATGPVKGVPTIDALRADIPTSDLERRKLHSQISEALFNSGFIYKEKFDDTDNSIESFQNLLSRYDTTSHELVAYYQLYRLYLKKESQKKADFFSLDPRSSSIYYKELILDEYPNSEFAAILRSPDGKLDNDDDSKSNKLYKNAFSLFKSDSMSIALNYIDSVLPLKEAAPVGGKLQLLKALCFAQDRQLNGMMTQLNLVITNFPNTEEEKEAKDLLSRVQKFLGSNGQTPATNPSDSSSVVINTQKMVLDSNSIYDPNLVGVHYYLVVCPKDKKVDVTELKTKMNKFNQKFFGSKGLTVTQSFITNEYPILLIKTFGTPEEGKAYYQAILTNQSKEIPELEKSGLQHYPISKNNFITLFKKKEIEAYFDFFNAAYL